MYKTSQINRLLLFQILGILNVDDQLLMVEKIKMVEYIVWKIKLENYNNACQQSNKHSSEVPCSHANLQPQFSDYSKDANGHQPKQDSSLKFASGLIAPIIPVSTQPSPLMQGYIPEINSCMPMLIPTNVAPSNATNKSDFRKVDNVVSQKGDYCFADGSASPGIPVSQSSDPPFRKYQCLDTTANLVQSGQPSSDVSLTSTPQQQQHQVPPQAPLQPQAQNAFVSAPRTSTVSEALFVQIIVSKCKRIAPLWFRGISSMRERNREENRRTSTNSGQTQNDWSIIAGKIRVSLFNPDVVDRILYREGQRWLVDYWNIPP